MLLQWLSDNVAACVALGFFVGVLLTLEVAGTKAWQARGANEIAAVRAMASVR